MAAAQGANIFAGKFAHRARVDDLGVAPAGALDHLARADGDAGRGHQLDRGCHRFEWRSRYRQAGLLPAFNAVVKHAHPAATKKAQGVLAKVGVPGAAPAVDDGLARRVEAGLAEQFFDARMGDEIFAVVIAQDTGSVADGDGTGQVAACKVTPITHIPHLHAALERLLHLRGINDGLGLHPGSAQHQRGR